ncbi:hypothetical protein L21SP3_01789 [Sedimentisphaera cyanobacteriorum]|uniref:Uncharacterized protein n=1 Tax=Sedimentisphaera cyanobacteriorum TaxID=1940790 RepID=A0A1Q2HR79_9BACT|nr:hypothetical protein [Sedimentisphaera cyanobacteriorum]AQQ09968.1 hypothetical protein L21SP3_01789 [Sedimentisphaera cyanobacteriorum]
MQDKKKNKPTTPRHEIALFIILLTALFSAWAMTVRKVQVNLTDSFQIPASGLKIRLPDGKLWSTKTENWEFDYESNYFFAGAVQTNSSDVRSASVQWRYYISPLKYLPTAMQNRYAQQSGSSVVRRGIIISRGFGTHWALCAPNEQDGGHYSKYGLIKLGSERFAELEVRAAEKQQCSELFELLIKQASYSPNPFINQGIELLDRVRLKSQFSYTPNKNTNSFLMESPNVYKGIMINRVKVTAHRGEKKELTVTDFGFSKVFNYNDIIFDERTRRFSWKRKRVTEKGKVREIIMENRGPNVEIIDLKTLAVNRRSITQVFWPEIFQMYLVKFFIFETDLDKCVVDTLMPQGQIVPVIFERVRTDEGLLSAKLKYTHKPDFAINVFFDKNQNIINFSDSDNNNTRKVNLHKVIKTFPEQENVINKFLKDRWRLDAAN